MDDQESQDFLKDLAMQQQDSDSEADEELANEVAPDHELCRQLFNDVVTQSQSGFGGDEVYVGDSDFTADSLQTFDFRSAGADVTDEASGFSRSGVQPPPELLEDTELFSGPAEWRHVWDWEIGECNRMIAEQNTLQYDDVENCTDSSESVEDVVGSYCASDIREHPLLLCMPGSTYTFVSDCEDMASAVSSSVVVNEPVCGTHSDLAGSSTVCDREVGDSNAIQSVLDDAVNSCLDKDVTWDSADESGLTELDKQKNAQFSQDFTSNGLEGRVLSIPVAGSSREHQDRVCSEDSCMDSGILSGFATSSIFAQRPTYSSGMHSRAMDSNWNPPRTPPTSDSDSCRWQTRKSWRKNSAGNTAIEIRLPLVNSVETSVLHILKLIFSPGEMVVTCVFIA